MKLKGSNWVDSLNIEISFQLWRLKTYLEEYRKSKEVCCIPSPAIEHILVCYSALHLSAIQHFLICYSSLPRLLFSNYSSAIQHFLVCYSALHRLLFSTSFVCYLELSRLLFGTSSSANQHFLVFSVERLQVNRPINSSKLLVHGQVNLWTSRGRIRGLRVILISGLWMS